MRRWFGAVAWWVVVLAALPVTAGPAKLSLSNPDIDGVWPKSMSKQLPSESLRNFLKQLRREHLSKATAPQSFFSAVPAGVSVLPVIPGPPGRSHSLYLLTGEVNGLPGWNPKSKTPAASCASRVEPYGKCFSVVLPMALDAQLLTEKGATEVKLQQATFDDSRCDYTRNEVTFTQDVQLETLGLLLLGLKVPAGARVTQGAAIAGPAGAAPVLPWNFDFDADGTADLVVFASLKPHGNAPHSGVYIALRVANRWSWLDIKDPSLWDSGC